jgi:hypothetical protein
MAPIFVGLDLAEHVFQIHAVDEPGERCCAGSFAVLA